MKKTILFLFFFQFSVIHYGQIIVDHSVVDKFDEIPQQYMDEVKKMWFVAAGESHSEAYRYGLLALEQDYPAYSVSVIESGTPEAYTVANLRASRATWGDISNSSGWIYGYGEEDWCTYQDYPVYTYNPDAVARTKAGITYCNTHNLTISAFGFVWCYDDGYNLVNAYLRATQEYVDYCASNGYPTKIFFTTGPVDGYIGVGEDGYNNYLRWEAVRTYVKKDPGLILFDYADILCYNDAGELATTTWDGHTYPTIHPDNVTPAGYGHIGVNGSYRIAKATWWMLARIAGWSGGTASVNEQDALTSPYFTVEATPYELVLKLNANVMPVNINLINLDGRLITRNKATTNLVRIQKGNMKPGLYLINVSNSKITETRKVIIY